jgi:hypothetical protein
MDILTTLLFVKNVRISVLDVRQLDVFNALLGISCIGELVSLSVLDLLMEIIVKTAQLDAGNVKI